MKTETSAQLLALSTDTLVEEMRLARIDGIVTADELDALEYRVGLLRLRAEGHAQRVRLGMRLINGGVCDRNLVANVRSYGRWSEEETARLRRLEAKESHTLREQDAA